jgi:hypothetical protein
MSSPTQKVTRGGQTLTAYGWWSLEQAYLSAGLTASELVVVQGSFKAGGGAAASGTTHDAGDTADMRTRTLPEWARANLCERVVVALRAHGWCAWYRDQQHGGMDPHIHAVYRWADPAPSSGARSQVSSYDRGRNGLSGSSEGPDYHPRPAQTRYPWPGDTPPATIPGGAPVAFIFKTAANGKTGAGAAYVVREDGTAFQLNGGFKASGLPVVESPDETTDERFYASTTRT